MVVQVDIMVLQYMDLHLVVAELLLGIKPVQAEVLMQQDMEVVEQELNMVLVIL